MNFIYLLKRATRNYPEKGAVIENGKVITYQECWEKINFVGKLYRDLGVKRNDRVIIVLPNSANFIFYHFAALKIGAISVPVKSEYKICEFAAILENCKPKIFVSCDKWLNENNSILKEFKPDINFISIDNINLKSEKTESAICIVRNSDIATLTYSYFGDGYPKGAALTHGNHIYAANGISKHVGFTSDDKFLIVLPMSHVFTLSGSINTSMIKGGTIVIIGSYLPRFIFSAVENYKITVLAAVPAVFEYLSKFQRKERYDLSSLRRCITGGDFMPERLHREFEDELKFQILQGYGLTETLPILCNPSGTYNRPGTLGLPGRRDIKLKIVNEENEEIKIGQTGEILVKSPTTMLGYYNLPDETNKILKDGWLYTRDIGKIDKDGFLYFYGLKKKIFNIYGNKVDPLEVRNVLLEHPFIEKVNIYLEILSNDKYIIGSKRICADIYVRDGQRISRVEIRDYCKEKIAAYKIPEKFNIYQI